MISAQEMVREVNNYRDNNKKIVEEYLEELSNRIYDVKKGETEKMNRYGAQKMNTRKRKKRAKY